MWSLTQGTDVTQKSPSKIRDNNKITKNKSRINTQRFLTEFDDEPPMNEGSVPKKDNPQIYVKVNRL